MGKDNFIPVEGGVPIKAWTKGVRVDPAAEQQLKNVAGLPVVFHPKQIVCVKG